MSFADNVKRLRLVKNYSQSELGALIGVSQQMIADYENGRKKPTIETCVDLARKLDTTVEQLVDSLEGTSKKENEIWKQK